MWFKLITVFLCLCFTQCCRDEKNNPVDWYVLYKLPKQSHHKNQLIQKGHAYAYITSNDENFTWKLSQLSIEDPNSIPGLTLFPFYSNQSQMHIFYNDEAPPDNKNEILGHTKGIVFSGKESGFWLVHSVPLYPTVDTYSFPETGTHFGQSFLCLSLDIPNLNEVGKQLIFNEPNIYKSNLDVSLKERMPNIQKVIDKQHVKLAPFYNLNKIETVEGVEFLSFAKSRHFGKELYSDWVAPVLQDSLNVESWLRGKGRIDSDCSQQYYVKNIEGLDMDLAAGIIFKSENDHSKWAVTAHLDKEKYPWLCVGDINRQEHQKQRGGGTVCTSDYSLREIWRSYHSIINKTEPCNNKI